MAQIIKHRRGSLESVAGATKRAGELLVVTGSSGITAANGDSVLFLGVDGSTVTPANKILQGTSVPNLTGASYDTSIDGLPFYDTSAEKLYILNKAGNVEIKATANTGGTGIVSSSAQIDGLGFLQVDGDSVVSSSAQISGYNTFLEINGDSVVSSSAQISAYNTFLEINGDGVISSSAQLTTEFDTRYLNTNGDGVHSGSAQVVSAIASQDVNLGGISGSSLDVTGNAKIDGNLTLGGNITIGDAQTDTLTLTADLSSDIIPDGDNTRDLGASGTAFAEIHGTNIYGTLNGTLNGVVNATNGVISGSSQLTSEFDTRYLNTNGDGVVSGSGQIDGTAITNNTITIVGNSTALGGSVTLANITDGSGIVSGSSQITVTNSIVDASAAIDHTKINFGGSGITSGSLGLSIAGGTGTDTVQTGVDTLTFSGTANEIVTAVTDNTVTFSLPDDVTIGNDLTVTGDLTVSGTTTSVNSTTVNIGDNIIELNGTGATYGGLMIGDVTAPNQVSGSLLWDATNDQWIAGPSGSESKVLLAGGDGVISGSSQISSLGSFLEVNGDGVVSGSGQISLSGLSDYDANDHIDHTSVSITAGNGLTGGGDISATRTINVVSANNGIVANADNIELDTASSTFTDGVKSKLNTEGVISSSAQIDADFLNTNGDGVFSGSAQVDGTAINNNTITIAGTSTALGGSITYATITNGTGTISGSAQLTTEFDTRYLNTNSDGVISGSEQVNADSITNFDSNVLAYNNSLGVVSGSSQISADQTDGWATDVKTQLNSNTVISGSSQVSVTNSIVASDAAIDHTKIDFGGSQITSGSLNFAISGSSGNDVVQIGVDALSFAGGTGVTAAVTDNTVTYNVQDGSTSQKGIASFSSTNFGVTSGNVSIKSGGVPATALNADVAGTGISLNGVDNSVEVDYGSTAGTAVEGNTSLTVQGTSNEIEVSGGSVTLGNGGTVTVGLPSDVTIGNDLTVTTDLSVGGNATITGNLSVLGETTTVDSTTVQIGDNILELNIGGAQSTAGLQVTDATAPNTVSGSLLWDGTNDYWKGGALGSEKEFARLDSSPTSNTVLKADANGLLVDSLITDDGTNVTISGTAELRINAGTANSFVYFDSNKSLEAVTPSNDGDVIQWNGSSFVASNEIDGGTF